MGNNDTATEATHLETVDAAPAEPTGTGGLANETEVDPEWRKHVHLRPDDTGKSSLEHCISELHKEHYDSQNAPFTLTAGERTEDLGSHLVYLQ